MSLSCSEYIDIISLWSMILQDAMSHHLRILGSDPSERGSKP